MRIYVTTDHVQFYDESTDRKKKLTLKYCNHCYIFMTEILLEFCHIICMGVSKTHIPSFLFSGLLTQGGKECEVLLRADHGQAADRPDYL